MASALDRISLTLPSEMIVTLDAIVDDWDYASRSEAIRDALRELFTRYRWEADPDGQQRGTVVVIHDHHVNGLPEKLLELQHEYHNSIISVQHVHLDHDRCLETVIVNGSGREIQSLTNNLRSMQGVREVKLAVVGE